MHVGITSWRIRTLLMKYRCLTPHPAAAAKALQSWPILCDPIDGSPPGSPVPGILQARTLEWVAISFSNASKWKVKVKSLSRVWLFATPWTAVHQAPPPMGFSRQEYWSGVLLPSPGHCLFHFVGLQCSSCASVSLVKLAAEKYHELNRTQKDHRLLYQLPSRWQSIDYGWILNCFAGQLHFSVALKCLWEHLKQVMFSVQIQNLKLMS